MISALVLTYNEENEPLIPISDPAVVQFHIVRLRSANIWILTTQRRRKPLGFNKHMWSMNYN